MYVIVCRCSTTFTLCHQLVYLTWPDLRSQRQVWDSRSQDAAHALMQFWKFKTDRPKTAQTACFKLVTWSFHMWEIWRSPVTWSLVIQGQHCMYTWFVIWSLIFIRYTKASAVCYLGKNTGGVGGYRSTLHYACQRQLFCYTKMFVSWRRFEYVDQLSIVQPIERETLPCLLAAKVRVGNRHRSWYERLVQGLLPTLYPSPVGWPFPDPPVTRLP